MRPVSTARSTRTIITHPSPTSMCLGNGFVWGVRFYVSWSLVIFSIIPTTHGGPRGFRGNAALGSITEGVVLPHSLNTVPKGFRDGLLN